MTLSMFVSRGGIARSSSRKHRTPARFILRPLLPLPPPRRCETVTTAPEGMDPPTLSGKRSTSLTLKWSAPDEPGGKLKINYILHWDGGKGDTEEEPFVELYAGQERRYKVPLVEP